MFTLNEATTVGQLVDNLNRFLSFKRSTSFNASELPTCSLLMEYLRKVVAGFESAFSAGVAKAISESNGTEDEEASCCEVDFWAYTMLDIHTMKTDICLVSWRGEDPVPLLTITPEYGQVDEVSYVKCVTCADDMSKRIVDLMVQAALAQEKRATVVSRWLEAPVSFRQAHTICPVCHSTFLELFRGGDFGERAGHVECHHCGWESKLKYYYGSELADDKSYRKELRHIMRIGEMRNILRQADKELDLGLSNAASAYKMAVSCGGPSHEAKDLIEKYIKRLTSLQAEWEAKSKGKEVRR